MTHCIRETIPLRIFPASRRFFIILGFIERSTQVQYVIYTPYVPICLGDLGANEHDDENQVKSSCFSSSPRFAGSSGCSSDTLFSTVLM